MCAHPHPLSTESLFATLEPTPTRPHVHTCEQSQVGNGNGTLYNKAPFPRQTRTLQQKDQSVQSHLWAAAQQEQASRICSQWRTCRAACRLNLLSFQIFATSERRGSSSLTRLSECKRCRNFSQTRVDRFCTLAGIVFEKICR